MQKLPIQKSLEACLLIYCASSLIMQIFPSSAQNAPRDMNSKEILAQIRRDEDATYDYSKYPHPVLKVLPRKLLPDNAITPQLLTSFANYHRVTLPHYLLEKWYQDAEMQVLKKFCSMSLKKEPKDILILAGEPFYKGRFIPCWEETANFSSTWIYSFGPLKRYVSLGFKEGRCISAEIKNLKQTGYFADWMSEYLSHKAIGLSILQIQNVLGADHLTYLHNKTALSTSNAKNATSIEYEPDTSHLIVLEIEYGACKKVTTNLMAH